MRSLVFVLLLALSPVPALAQFCGVVPITPVPPVGCTRLEPVCVCDAQGRCFWQFMCVR